jgi:hypothetical protein
MRLDLIALPLLFFLVGCWGVTSSVSYKAEYADKALVGGPNRFYDLFTGGETRGFAIANVYLTLSTGEVIYLPSMNEDVARKWVDRKDEILRKSSIGKLEENGVEVAIYDIDGLNAFHFSDSKLRFCHICGVSEGPLANCQIGATPKGESLSFPIALDDLTRVFGKPNRVRKVTQHGR